MEHILSLISFTYKLMNAAGFTCVVDLLKPMNEMLKTMIAQAGSNHQGYFIERQDCLCSVAQC